MHDIVIYPEVLIRNMFATFEHSELYNNTEFTIKSASSS